MNVHVCDGASVHGHECVCVCLCVCVCAPTIALVNMIEWYEPWKSAAAESLCVFSLGPSCSRDMWSVVLIRGNKNGLKEMTPRWKQEDQYLGGGRWRELDRQRKPNSVSLLYFHIFTFEVTLLELEAFGINSFNLYFNYTKQPPERMNVSRQRWAVVTFIVIHPNYSILFSQITLQSRFLFYI